MAYLGSCQTSAIELFAKKIIVAKNSSKYTSDMLLKKQSKTWFPVSYNALRHADSSGFCISFILQDYIYCLSWLSICRFITIFLLLKPQVMFKCFC